ncbi:MAG: GntR family transcriptional regulator [Alphaproteobacteria bacterium]
MTSDADYVNQQASEKIATDLREKILRGDLAPATRLKQRKIASEYGVSLMPARDAIKKLVRDGLAICPTPKTFVVAPVSATDFIEVMELRLLLEPEALERSAPRLTPDDLSQLENYLTIQSDDFTPLETASNHWDFHCLLYSRMGRPRTLEIIERLNLHLNRYLVPIWSTVGIQSDWVSNHRTLLTLVERGDITGAVKKLRRDLDTTMLRVVKDITV